jgi:hypothetical protein
MASIDSKISENYSQMCKLMIDSHKKLVEQLNDIKIQGLIQNDVLLFFGPTKSGKSTLLGRIKSNKSCEEFLQLLKISEVKGHDFVEIEGIPVRGGVLSGTIVPNFYTKDNSLIMDLAGFGDTTAGRSEVISLLNNGLFSKMKSCKILIVLDLAILNTLTLVMDKYVNEFIKLMTKQHFINGLSACGFIFTKADMRAEEIIKASGIRNSFHDEVSDDELLYQAVGRMLDKFALQMIRANKDIASFTSCITENYCVIDYSKMDSKTTCLEIEKVLKKVKPLNSNSLSFDLLSVRSKLSDEGAEVVQQYQEIRDEKENELRALKDFIFKSHKDKLEEMKRLRELIDNTKKILETNQLRMMVLTQIINTNTVLINEMKSKLLLLADDVKQNNLQLLAFKSRSDEFTMMQITIIRSNVIKGVMSERYDVNFEVIRPIGSNDRVFLVIMTAPDFETQKTKIHECRTIAEFKKKNLTSVYINGQMSNNDRKMDIKVSSEQEVYSKVVASSSFPFVVLCMNDVQLVNTPHVGLITDHFVNHISKLNTNVLNTTIELDRYVKETKLAKDELESKGLQNNELNERLRKAETDLGNKKIDYKTHSESLINQLTSFMSELKRTLQGSIFTLTEELGEILVLSHIEVEIFKEMPKVRNTINGMINEEDNLREQLLKNSNEIVFI